MGSEQNLSSNGMKKTVENECGKLKMVEIWKRKVYLMLEFYNEKLERLIG